MSHRDAPNAYPAWRAIGPLPRIAVVIFVLSIVALWIGVIVGDDWRRPITTGSLVSGALAALLLGAATRNWFWSLMGVYVVLVGVGSVLQDLDPRPRAAVIAVSIGTIAAVVCAIVVAIRGIRRSRELERLLFSESTSVAFFVTMLGAVSYGLLEAWIDAPRVSMWVVWSIGMVAWMVAGAIFKRRYS